MKTKTIFKYFALFLALGIMSCGSDDPVDGGGSSATVSSIALSVPSTAVYVGQTSTFAVVDNLGNNVAATSELTIAGVVITNPHTFAVAGSYEIIATNNSLTSNTVTVVVSEIPTPTSITLTTSAVSCGLNDQITFTVMDDLGNNVTNISTYTVDGVATTTNPHTFSVAGSLDVVATFNTLVSSAVSVTVVAPSAPSDSESFTPTGAPLAFTKKVLLEDFTGTWCGQCPGAGAAMVNTVNGNNILGVGYHASGGDPMEISETAYWSNYYNVTGFPTVYVNGADTRWNFPGMAQVNAELAETATVGLAVTANNVGGKLDLEVKVGYNAAINEEVKLMIYLVEDDVTVNVAQAGSSQGANYVHHDVLREVYTGQLGDVISAGNIATGGVYTRTITGLDFPAGMNLDKVKVIAFVRNTYTKTFTDYFNDVHTNSPHYDIYNVQEVHLGSSKAFD